MNDLIDTMNGRDGIGSYLRARNRDVRIAILCLLISCVSAARGDDLYLKEVKPLLKHKCWGCHGPLKQEAGLRLDAGTLILSGGDSGPALVAQDAAESLILQRVASQEEFERMPPEGEPLTAKQVGLLQRWIEGGANFPQEELPQEDPQRHWAFQPLQTFSADEIPDSTGIVEGGTNPIDLFISRKLEAAGLQLSPPADPQARLRRLYLTMHGLSPDWETVENFVSDPTAQRFREQVEAVLASPRYGERWGQHWLDVVRYADTHGFEVNTSRPNAWPYRDYVIEAFNSDKPYDQFVKEQIAGDTMGVDAATGFLVAAAVLLPGQIGKDDASIRLARQDALDEMIVGTSATFLGLTLGCARCHDHKFDPLTARDYYSMQAFFAGVEYGDREIHDAEYERRQQEAKGLEPILAKLQQELKLFEPVAFSGQTILIDDENLDRVEILKTKNGHGSNPPGTARGYQDDPGSSDRIPNVSGGRYTWWDNQPGEDVLAYLPKVSGTFEVWISWGAHGSGVHTRDARYVFDEDGDLQTKQDQREIASVDQYYVAGRNSGETEKKPLWSGLQSAGVHELHPESKILVRGGTTGTGITADVILLQERSEITGQHPIPRLREPVNFEKNVERFSPARTKQVRFTSLATTKQNRYEPCLDELEIFTAETESRNVALASSGAIIRSSGNLSNSGRHQLSHLNDGQYGNERSWISNQKGKGWVEVEFSEPMLIDRVVWGRDRLGKLKDRLPVEYQVEVLDAQGNWMRVAGSSDRLPLGTKFDQGTTIARNIPAAQGEEFQSLSEKLLQTEKRLSTLKRADSVFAGKFRKPDNTQLLNRGDPEQPLEPVPPAVPEILGTISLGSVENEQQRRVALANWLAMDDNPLTARVIVNRIWQSHFGTGIVETASDFGINGARPSHPELLDWLAGELIRSNWSIKHIQRLILTSRTWGQSNRILQDAQEIDGSCRLLWRFPSRRLEAEVIRDSLLQVSGELNLKMGGPGFDFFKSRGGLNGFPPVVEFKANGLRRMIYAHKVRMEPVPIFGAFDCPDAGQPTPSRSRSTTAIQALNLFNSPFVAERAIVLAGRVEAEEKNPEEAVSTCYRRILSRSPTAQEIAQALPIVQEHGLPTLVRVLLNCNEFLMLP